MKIITAIATGVCAIGLVLSGYAAIHHSGRPYTFHHENVLGTSLELKFAASTPQDAEIAEAAALEEIDRLAQILSTYNPKSEVSQWLATSNEPVVVSPELFEVLWLFDTWRERTGGALDASAEAVIRVWKMAAAAHRLPTKEEITAATAQVRQAHWKLDRSTGTATHLSKAPISLNSFTKSYIISRANDAAMASANISAAVVNIGGDLVVRGEFTETVQIADPKADAENGSSISNLLVHDRAVATSGNYRRGLEIGGRHYSHIVDPRTGSPVDHIISSTVVAPDAVDAGVLATAFSVLSVDESQHLADSMPGVDYLLVKNDGTRIASRGWSAIEAPGVQLASAAFKPIRGVSLAAGQAASGGTWPTAFELVVNLELARIEGQRTRRPYVAVWIEDKDKFPVRTLALWYQKPKWLPDLKAWQHSDKLRTMAEGSDITNSISSATRSPGKYSVKWDGKDNNGKLVKAGKYTVFIEAAREHGTYQLIHQEMDFAGSAKQISLTGNVEVAAASLDYRKSN